MRRGQMRIWLTAVVIVLFGLLAGCEATGAPAPPAPTTSAPTTAQPQNTQESGSPTSSPATTVASVKSYTSPPPTSESEAIEHAIAAAAVFLATTNRVWNDPSKSSELVLVATGSALADENSNVEQLLSSGARGTGFATFDPFIERSLVSDLQGDGLKEPIVPFGIVTLHGCTDISNLGGVNADGSGFVSPEISRFRSGLVAKYDTSGGIWLVSSTFVDGSEVTHC